MTIGIAHAISVVGIEGHLVRIEAAILRGLPAFTIVGLPDTAVSESRERIRAAFSAAGIAFPAARLTVNLSPADTPKSGSGFDLGIAAAILGAMGNSGLPARTAFMGELGLDGTVRRVKGILPAAIACAHTAYELWVPEAAVEEAGYSGASVTGIWHLTQLAERAGAPCSTPPPHPPTPLEHTSPPAGSSEAPDLIDVRGQEEARLALEVAAAGGHHLLMTGSPGIGKSMLAQRLPGILPPLSPSDAVEVASVLSALGEFDGVLPHGAPFSSPHHTVSATALIGGGTWPRPGAVSRAHRGILFLDEMPEFASNALQALRQPLECGTVEIHRTKATVTFPARFQLIGAANPCRCGRYLDDPQSCTCAVRDRRDYARRIGGPILDRFDITIIVHRLSRFDLATASHGEPSSVVADRVREARARQDRRYRNVEWSTNAGTSGAWLRANVSVPHDVTRELDDALSAGRISMRGADKILRIAMTLADLGGLDAPNSQIFHHAFTYRMNGASYER